MKTLTMQGIADLAGVRRPVVSMWRRRHADGPHAFPAPATEQGLVFEAAEVARWLATSGLGNNAEAQVEAALHSSTLGRALQDLDHASALLLLHELGGEPVDELDADTAAHLVNGHSTAPVLTAEHARRALEQHELCAAVDELAEAAFSGGRVLDRMVRTFTDAQGPWAPEAFTTAGERLLGTVLAELWRAHPRTVVPVGPAGLLLAGVLADRLEEGEHVSFGRRLGGGQPTDDAAWRRLAAFGHPVLSAQQTGGWPLGALVLVQQQGVADESAFVNRIEDLLLDLGPHDALVVVGPAHLLTDPQGADARRRLLTPSGSYVAPLRYVARLPKGLSRFGGRRRLALWVFADSPSTPGRQSWTVVGAHSDTHTDAGACTAIAADVAAATARAIDVNAHAFRSSRVLVSERVLRRDDLAAPPSSPAEVSGGERLARVWELDRTLSHPRVVHRSLLHGLDVAASEGSPVTLSLRQATRELARDLAGVRIPPEQVGAPDAGTVTVVGPQEVRDPASVGRRAMDRLTLETLAPRARFTEPGDIIYVAAGGPAAMVDHHGGHLVQAPARILRCRDAEQDDRQLVPSVVAADIAAQQGSDRGTWRLRTVPVNRVAAVEEIHRRASQRRQHLLDELGAIDTLETELMNGLSAGTLTATPREEEARHP